MRDGMERLSIDGQHDLAALLTRGLVRRWSTAMTATTPGPTAPMPTGCARRATTADDPWTDYVIAVRRPEASVLSGWKMRNVRLPARVAEAA